MKSILNRKGQGLVEYALLIAAVCSIIVLVGRGTLKTGEVRIVQQVMSNATAVARSI